MKKFTIPCKFGSLKAPFDVYIGEPSKNESPLKYQARWLLKERGGIIPEPVMESFHKLQYLALKNNVSFEDLVVYALETANKDRSRIVEKVNENLNQNKTDEKNNKDTTYILDEKQSYHDGEIIDLTYLISVYLDVSGDENITQALEIFESQLNDFPIFRSSLDLIRKEYESQIKELDNDDKQVEIKIEEIKDYIANKILLLAKNFETYKQSENSQFKAGEIIFHIKGDLGVAQSVSFLQLVENAYARLSTFLDINAEFDKNEQTIDSIINSYSMEVGRISIASPGIWTFLGSLNPLQQIREYLNDRHERKKDKSYRNSLDEKDKEIEIQIKEQKLNTLEIENEKRLLENSLLQYKIIQEKIDFLKSIGVSKERIDRLVLDLVSRPMIELKEYIIESELIGEVEVMQVEHKHK